MTGSSLPTNCPTGEGNIFNSHLIIDQPLNYNVLLASTKECVGSSIISNQASYVTLWADDPITPEVDGLIEGDSLLLPFSFETDAIYSIRSATIDTTFSILLDSLQIEVVNLIQQRDSLQGLVDNFPNQIAQLTSDLAASNSLNASLSLEISNAKEVLRSILNLLRN